MEIKLKTINQVGLFVMGEKDSFAFGDAQKHLQMINDNSKSKNNTVRVVESAGHTFRNKEKELAQTILEFVKEI